MHSLFYAGMGANEQAGAKIDWWAAAADQVMRHKLAFRSIRARRDERHAKRLRIAIVVSLFFVFLAGALLIGGNAVIDPLIQAAADGREARQLGQIVYTMPDGEFCRHFAFDNMTGEITEGTITQCTYDRPKVRTREAMGFAWGAR
jgi:hypothetical protein